MNFKDLLNKAKWSEITQKEIELVILALQQKQSDVDTYTLLHIVGRSSFTKYENLVVSFLDAKDDPMLARLALQILCSFWNKTDIYLDYVKIFLAGVDWDDEDDVRSVAISITGNYLQKHNDVKLLEMLVDIFTDNNIDQLLRQSAYLALGQAYGKKWDELPPGSKYFDLEKDTDPAVLEWAIQKI